MRTLRQLAIGALALSSTALGGTIATTAPAAAGVSVGIGIGVPGPAFYGEYRIRTGRCGNPRFAFNHPDFCGYPRFSEPVFIDGVWVNEPLYYRTYGGVRYFWHGGRWVVGHGSWDGRVFRGNWRDTWRARGWDRDDMRDRMQDRREDMRDRMQDRREDMRDRDNDRDHDNMRDRDNDRDHDNMRDRDRDDRGGDKDRDDRNRDRDNDRDNNAPH